MRQTGWVIDANLLVLLVVGMTSRHLINKHRRLKRFSVDDYDRLVEVEIGDKLLFVTPNTLTEASNLLAYHNDPERSLFFNVLRSLIENSQEIIVASVDASHNSAFSQLGLTDAAILEVVSAETPLLTVDLELYLAALKKAPESAVNFTYRQAL